MHNKYLPTFQDLSTPQLVCMLDEAYKYEPEAIEAVQLIIAQRNITEQAIESARHEAVLLQKEQEKQFDRKIVIYLRREWKEINEIFFKLRKLETKDVFVLFFTLACILIFYHSINKWQELRMDIFIAEQERFDRGMPWIEKMFNYLLVLFLPACAILLGIKKRVGWSLMIVGMSFFIPRLLMSYYTYLHQPVFMHFYYILPKNYLLDYIITPILFGLIIYKLSTLKMRNYLNIKKDQVILTAVVSGIAFITPWFFAILKFLARIYDD